MRRGCACRRTAVERRSAAGERRTIAEIGLATVIVCEALGLLVAAPDCSRRLRKISSGVIVKGPVRCARRRDCTRCKFLSTGDLFR